VDDATVAAMLTALKLAGDHVAVVFDRPILLGDGGEGLPAFGMGGDRLVEQLIDLVETIELPQALDGGGELFRDVVRGICGRRVVGREQSSA
jgi:hypothetical protein